MSHFNALVAIQLPENCMDPIAASEQELQNLAKLQEILRKNPSDFAAMFVLRTLQRKLNSLENAAEQQVDLVLAPYCESTDDPKYLEFVDCEENESDRYENGVIDCVRLPDGRIISQYASIFSRKYEVYEGLVYRRRFGQLHHRKRTKKARRISLLPQYPIKRLFPTLESYLEEYCGHTYNEDEEAYGYYHNPNAYWDWYQIGGRWPYRFLVKKDCPFIGGERDLFLDDKEEAPAPEGYHWVAGARKGDIAWALMKQLYLEDAINAFRFYEDAFHNGVLPKELGPFVHITEDGIFALNDLLYLKSETLDQYLARNGLAEEDNYPISTFAYVSKDGWVGSGDMGWFGCSTNDKDKLEWAGMVQEFINSRADNDWLISVDCHI